MEQPLLSSMKASPDWNSSHRRPIPGRRRRQRSDNLVEEVHTHAADEGHPHSHGGDIHSHPHDHETGPITSIRTKEPELRRPRSPTGAFVAHGYRLPRSLAAVTRDDDPDDRRLPRRASGREEGRRVAREGRATRNCVCRTSTRSTSRSGLHQGRHPQLLLQHLADDAPPPRRASADAEAHAERHPRGLLLREERSVAHAEVDPTTSRCKSENKIINFLTVPTSPTCSTSRTSGGIEFHPLHAKGRTRQHPTYAFFDLDPMGDAHGRTSATWPLW